MPERIAISLSIGALLHESFHVGLPQVALLSAVGALAIVISRHSVKETVQAIMLACTCMFGALAIMHASRPAPPAVFGDRIFAATVRSVSRELSGTSIVVRDRDTKEKFQLFLAGQSPILPGDDVSVSARIERPEPFLTESGRMFPYERYLAGKGIAGIGRDAAVSVLKEGGFSLARAAAVIRFRIADVYARYLSFPVDGIIAGMTVGYQGGIPEDMEKLFRDTGVLHVLVLSGYNITLLGGFLGMLLKGLAVRFRTLAVLLAVIFLVAISGGGPASVRAGIMGGIALLAGLSLRTYRPIRALCVAYLCFFAASPLSVFYDPGLHLSFLATSYMVLLLPRVLPLLSFLPAFLREALLLAVSMPLFMLPYTMYFSGAFPLAAAPANMLLSIAVPTFMVFAFLVLAASWIPPLSLLMGSILSVAGNAMIGMLESLSRMPVWQTPPASGRAVLFLYAVLYAAALMRQPSPRRSAAPPASS